MSVFMGEREMMRKIILNLGEVKNVQYESGPL